MEVEMNQTTNHYYATAETLTETQSYGVVHIFTDVNGNPKEVILNKRFSSMKEAELFAKELNNNNRIYSQEQ